ncbi:MAG: exonuclease domain-containing protein [Bacilli bacterium]
MTVRFAIVDLETTGNRPKEDDRIIEIAICVVENGQIVDTYGTLVNPERNIPSSITALTSITEEMVAHAPTFSTIVDDVVSRMDGAVFVAHNVMFDYTFLQAELERANALVWDMPRLDTVELAQIFFPTLQSYRLGNIAEELQIPLQQAHRALDDTEATARIFIKMLEKYVHLPGNVKRYLDALQIRMRGDWQLFVQGTTTIEHDYETPYELVAGIHIQPAQEELNTITKDTMCAHFLATKIENAEEVADDVLMGVENWESTFPVYTEFPTEEEEWTYTIYTALQKNRQTSEAVVLSFATEEAGQRFRRDVLEEVERILGAPVPLVIAKPKRAFVDLTKTRIALESKDEEVSWSLITTLMSVAVWLAETKTGDLSELNVRLPNEELTERFGCTDETDEEGAYFYTRFVQQTEHARIVVTHHDFVLAHAAYFNDRFRYFMFLNTAHLVQRVFEHAHQSYSFARYVAQCQHITRDGTDTPLSVLLEHARTSEVFELQSIAEQLEGIDTHLTSLWGTLQSRLRGERGYLTQTNHPLTHEERWRETEWVRGAQQRVAQFDRVTKRLYNRSLRKKYREAFRVWVRGISQLQQHLEALATFTDPNRTTDIWLADTADRSGFRFVCFHDEEQVVPFFPGNSALYFTDRTRIEGRTVFPTAQLLNTETFVQLEYRGVRTDENPLFVCSDGIPWRTVKDTELLQSVRHITQVAKASETKRWIVLVPNIELLYLIHDNLQAEHGLLFEYASGMSLGRLRKQFEFDLSCICFMSVTTFLRERWNFSEPVGVVLLKLPFPPAKDPYDEWQQRTAGIEGYHAFYTLSVVRARRSLQFIKSTAEKIGTFYCYDARVIQERYGKEFQRDYKQGVILDFFEKIVLQ